MLVKSRKETAAEAPAVVGLTDQIGKFADSGTIAVLTLLLEMRCERVNS